MQIVEEEGEGMLACECADESTEYELKAALCFLWRKFGNRRLSSYDELQLWNEVDNELSVRTYRRANGVAPPAQLCFTLTQKRTDKVLKRLRQSGVRDIALVLVELD